MHGMLESLAENIRADNHQSAKKENMHFNHGGNIIIIWLQRYKHLNNIMFYQRMLTMQWVITEFACLT